MDTISAREREEWTPSVQGRGRNGHRQCKAEGGMMDTISARVQLEGGTMDIISAREREEWTPSVQGRGRNDGHHQCKGEGGMMDTSVQGRGTMDTISAREREE